MHGICQTNRPWENWFSKRHNPIDYYTLFLGIATVMSFSHTHFSLFWIIFSFQSPAPVSPVIITQNSESSFILFKNLLLHITKPLHSLQYILTLTYKLTYPLEKFLKTPHFPVNISCSSFLPKLPINITTCLYPAWIKALRQQKRPSRLSTRP